MPALHRPFGRRVFRLAILLVASAVGLATVAGPALAAEGVPNRAPVAEHDTVATTVGQPVVMDVLANDTDPDGDSLTVTNVSTSSMAGATATIGADNRLTYTAGPTPGWDNVSYTVSDGHGGQSTGYIAIAVAAVDTDANDPPLVSGDSVEVLEGKPVTINVLANDLDVDSQLTVTSVTQPGAVNGASSGTVVLNGDQTVTYTPPPAGLPYSSTSFSYNVTDGANAATGSVYVSFRNVNGPENDAPFAAPDSAITLPSRPVTIAVLANDMDVDGDPVRLTGATLGYPGGGSSSGTVSADLTAGTVTYTPPASSPSPSYPPSYGYFNYTISDGRGGTASAQVNVSILAEDPATDDAPRLSSDSAVTVRNTPVTIDVLANDTDIDTPRSGLTVTVSGSYYPSPSAPVVNPDKTITYTPPAGVTGSQSFSYTVSDGPNSASAQVNVDVLAIDGPGNDAPIGQSDNATVLQDRTATLAVLGNDYDFDGNTLQIIGLRSSSYSSGPDAASVTTYGGTASVTPGGTTITYTPRAGYTGSDNFAYTVSDGQGGTATVGVSVTIAPVETGNKRPILASDATHVVQGGTVVVRPLANDFDPDGDQLTITTVTAPYSGGTATLADDHQSFTYQAPASYVGSTYVSFSVSDGHNHLETGSVEIYVELADTPDVNDPPRAGTDRAIATSGSPVTIDVLANDFDIDTPRSGLDVTIAYQPGNGTVVVNPDKTITYTPAAGATGSFGFSYLLSDGENACLPFNPCPYPSLSGSVSVQVLMVDTAANDGPAVRSDYLSARAQGTTTLAVLANDYDVDAGDTLHVTRLFSSPSDAPATTLTFSDGATAQVTPDGTAILFTAPAGASSWHSFSYTASDGEAEASNSVSVNGVTPSGTNQAPTLATDAVAVRWGGSVVAWPLANDFDVDGDTLTIDTASTYGGATVTVNADHRSLTITAPASASGSPGGGMLSVSYSVSDGHGHVSYNTVEVNPVLVDDPATNEAPVAASDIFVSTGGPVTLDVLANDFDLDTDRSHLTVSVAGTMSGTGNVVRNADNTVTYTPNPGSFGANSFSYTVSDGTNSASGNATVDVLGMNRPGNDAPVARDDYNLAVLRGTTRDLPVLANDYDFDSNDELRITGLQRYSGEPAASTITTSSGGTAQITAGGTAVRFTPGTGSSSSSSEGFSYTVSDGTVSVTKSVTVTVITTGNQAPTTMSDSAMVGEGNTVDIDPLVNDYDADGDPLRIVSAYASSYSGTSNGTVAVSDDGRRLTYRAGSAGNTSISYTVSDGHDHTAYGYVNVLVHPVNHPGNDTPQAKADNGGVYAGQTVTLPVLANDFDIDGDALTVSRVFWYPNSGYASAGEIAVGPDHRSVVYTATSPSAGPPPSSVYFQYEVSDGFGGTATAQVSIAIYQRNTAANEPPTANYDSAVTTVGVPVTIAVLANDTDIDGDALAVASVTPYSGPAAADLRISADRRSVVYTPSADPAVTYQGFSYTISDGHGGTASSYGSIIVLAADSDGNDAPFARPDSAATYQGRSVHIPVLVNDFDADGDTLTIEAVSGQPEHGSATVAGDELVYTPHSVFAGYDTFRYRITDGALTSEAAVNVQVQFYNGPGNDAPVSFGFGASTVEDQPVTVDVLPAAFDYEHDAISLASVGTPGHGTAAIVAGRIQYTPAPGYVGSDRFSFTLTDGTLASEPAFIDVYINPDPNVQQVPVASGSSLTTDEDTPAQATFTADDGADADPLTFVVVDGPGHGQVDIRAGGAFTYTPAAGWSGTDSFSFVARDFDGESAPATVSVTVRPVNDAPVAGGDQATATSGAAIDIAVLGNDSDAEGDTLTVTAVSAPAHGTAGIVSGGHAVRYQSGGGFTGTDTFSYTASDGHGGATTATVTIQVARQAVEVVADPGEPVVSREEASPEFPVAIAVTSPSGGRVSIVENPATGSQSGYTLLGSQITIEAPPASAVDPLRLVFRLDRTALEAAGGSVDNVTVFRNGSPAADCIGSTTANPDPCVTSRQYDAATNDVVLTVLAVHASQWALGVALPAPVTPATPTTPTTPATPTAPATTAPSTPARTGYWMLGADGKVYNFGDATKPGEPAGSLADPAVDLEPTPDGTGYWVVDAKGRIYAYNATPFANIDPSVLKRGEQVTSLSATRNGDGLWIFTNKGRVIVRGTAQHYGDVSKTDLNGPVLDSIAATDGNGYYMVASDGGVFAFGSAVYHGSMGGKKLNAPVQSLVPDPDGTGYWLVASDGGIFAFEADFHGSMGGKKLNKPVTGMVPYGQGYLMVGEDGGIFDFSDDRDYLGSLGDRPPASPIVSVAVLDRPAS